MTNTIFYIILSFFLSFFLGKSIQDTSIKQDVSSEYELALKDLYQFAEKISINSETSYEKAQRIIQWYAENFTWTYTDYRQRSIKEILQRKGGNCNELAKVATATMKALNLKMRKIREINIHRKDSLRQSRAEKKVIESGLKLSVFGYNHNDHVWIEIYDEKNDNWFPADPSIGVVGLNDWLKARFGFGDRFSLDPASKDMLFPFAIFAFDDNNSIIENRTEYYVINGFNHIYNNELEDLKSWKEWINSIEFLNEKASGALQGNVNLHNFTQDLIRLDKLYNSLKTEYEVEHKN